jgi:hypothetical protein
VLGHVGVLWQHLSSEDTVAMRHGARASEGVTDITRELAFWCDGSLQ